MNFPKARSRKWDLNPENGPISLLLHMMCRKQNARLWEYQKQKEGERDVYSCYHDYRSCHLHYALVPLAVIYTWTRDIKNSISKSQKPRHLARLKFSLKLIAYTVRNPHFHRYLPRLWEGCQQFVQRIYISVKYKNMTSSNSG